MRFVATRPDGTTNAGSPFRAYLMLVQGAEYSWLSGVYGLEVWD